MKKYAVILLIICMVSGLASCREGVLDESIVDDSYREGVLAETIVDAFIRIDEDREDNTCYMVYNMGIKYVGEREGERSTVYSKCRVDFDADSQIGYYEGTFAFRDIRNGMEAVPVEVKHYYKKNEDGSFTVMDWSESRSEWITSGFVPKTQSADREALLKGATVVEEETRYVLTTQCDASDVQFDVGRFLGADYDELIPCDAVFVIVVDKESMVCTGTNLMIDVEDLNAELKKRGETFRFTEFNLSTSETVFCEITLTMPE